MGEIYEEFERTLLHWQEKYRDRPDREAECLLLLAVEREQLVTTAYSNEFVQRRVEELPRHLSRRSLSASPGHGKTSRCTPSTRGAFCCGGEAHCFGCVP